MFCCEVVNIKGFCVLSVYFEYWLIIVRNKKSEEWNFLIVYVIVESVLEKII